MRRKGRPTKQKATKKTGKRGRPAKKLKQESSSDTEETPIVKKEKSGLPGDVGMPEGLHITTSQVNALGYLIVCRECGEGITISVKPTTKGMISEFTVSCTVCGDNKSTNTPNVISDRKRKREENDCMLQKTENINYAHVAAFLDNGLGYSGLRHYCKYFNARCLNKAAFVAYSKQVIRDVISDTEGSLLYAASIVREVFKSQLETDDDIIDLTVAYTTTYHQWGSDFCLVAGAVIELTTGLVVDYDVANMYCHVCKTNAKKIVSMSPSEMTEWFNKHQDTCEIREWCDELDHDAEEGVKEIEPKYLECFVAKKIWLRSVAKYGFRYTNLIHESDERIHEELSKAAIYDDLPILIDSTSSCFSRRKSEHARTSFQTKLKAKCPRERVQTKDRISYVYAMSIPEYNRFAISSNIKLRHLIKTMEDPLLIFEANDAIEVSEAEKLEMAEANAEEQDQEEVVPTQNDGQDIYAEEQEDEEEEEETENIEAEMEESVEAVVKYIKKSDPAHEQDQGEVIYAEIQGEEVVLIQNEGNGQETDVKKQEGGEGIENMESDEIEESTEAVVKYIKETDPTLKTNKPSDVMVKDTK